MTNKLIQQKIVKSAAERANRLQWLAHMLMEFVLEDRDFKECEESAEKIDDYYSQSLLQAKQEGAKEEAKRDKRMKIPTDYTKLTPADRKAVREQYVVFQKGKCLHCGKDLSKPAPKEITDKKIDWSLFPENFLRYPIHLQHNHNTRMTEGAVHNYCNAVMWQYQGK